MSAKGKVPDAWDDDWETVADKQDGQNSAPPSLPKTSKSERRAKHAEQQKLIWDAADNPNRSFFLESQGVPPPQQQDFKAPVQLLSRKPKGPTLAKRGDAANGMAGLDMQDDGDDSEEEERKRKEADFEERQRQAKIAREEKQQKYAEARARIMGSHNSASSGPNSRESSQGRSERKRGGKANGGQPRQSVSLGQSPSRGPTGDPKLFDPDDMGRRISHSSTPATPMEDQPVRQPRGPERSGRGGFGFVARGSLPDG